MELGQLLGQLPTPGPAPGTDVIPKSGDFWNPANYPAFINALGGPIGFFTFIILSFCVFAGVMIVLSYWKGIGAWKKCLTQTQKNQERQIGMCCYMSRLHTTPGGPGNTDQIRRAGIEIVELARGIGRKLGVEDTDKRADSAIDHLEPPQQITPDLPGMNILQTEQS